MIENIEEIECPNCEWRGSKNELIAGISKDKDGDEWNAWLCPFCNEFIDIRDIWEEIENNLDSDNNRKFKK